MTINNWLAWPDPRDFGLPRPEDLLPTEPQETKPEPEARAWLADPRLAPEFDLNLSKIGSLAFSQSDLATTPNQGVKPTISPQGPPLTQAPQAIAPPKPSPEPASSSALAPIPTSTPSWSWLPDLERTNLSWPALDSPQDWSLLANQFPYSLSQEQTYPISTVSAPKSGSPEIYPAPPALVGLKPVADLRADFPILNRPLPDGRPLIWLDNAATSQKPRAVIERLVQYYESENSNVHRGAHALADIATEAYERARATVARFIGAPGPENIVFVRGTTEALNLIAQAFVRPRLSPGDEIIVTALEHHANIVPWQMLAQQTGAVIKVAPFDASGQVIFSRYAELFTPRTRFVSLAHVSNVLGTVVNATEMVAFARSLGVPTAIDGAQSVPHLPVNVQALGADFFVFSGHKIFGPTGIGALYGTTEALQEAQPYQGGGSMIADVTFEKTIYRDPPDKFEAGTPNIAGAVGLGAALEYFSQVGVAEAAAYEDALLKYAEAKLSAIPGLKIIGSAPHKVSVSTFTLAGRSNEEIGAHLAKAGIALRVGHHCAQPTLRAFGLESAVRPSFAFYNTPEEVDQLVESVAQLAL